MRPTATLLAAREAGLEAHRAKLEAHAPGPEVRARLAVTMVPGRRAMVAARSAPKRGRAA